MSTFQSGFAAIVGRPNVGKSTLMNNILGTKIAIVTPKPQTTRNKIAGIATYDDCQVVFLDTPGIHEARSNLNRVMVDVAYSSLVEADTVCFIIDAFAETKRSGMHPGNREILVRLKESALPVILVVNKIDLVRKELMLPLIELYNEKLAPTAIIPISALNGDGIDRLLNQVRELMPAGEAYFPVGTLTDRSLSFLLTELVREQVFLQTHQEIPYSVAVSIDLATEMEGNTPPLFHVVASIHVERTSQKGMVSGKQGRMIKSIGQAARIEIQAYLKRKVFLELHVRIEKEWTRSLKGLHKVGYET